MANNSKGRKDKGPYFLSEAFEHSKYFLKWSNSHYEKFIEKYDREINRFQEEALEELALSVILSQMALEAFLNEMAVCELGNSETELTDHEKNCLKAQIESGKATCRRWRLEEKVCLFSEILLRQKFCKGEGGSPWEKLKHLINCRNILIHSKLETVNIFLDPGSRMKNGVQNPEDIALNCIPVSFYQILDCCNFDPSKVVKDIITGFWQAGYPLPESFRDVLKSV